MDEEILEPVELKKQILDAYSISARDLLKFLESKGLDDMECELCHSKTWAITSSGGQYPDIFAEPVIGQDASGGVGQATRAFYYCFCTGCGNTKQFYAEYVLSLIRPEPRHVDRFGHRTDSSGAKIE